MVTEYVFLGTLELFAKAAMTLAWGEQLALIGTSTVKIRLELFGLRSISTCPIPSQRVTYGVRCTRQFEVDRSVEDNCRYKLYNGYPWVYRKCQCLRASHKYWFAY
mmetsp:Transcript_28040/g.45130  ORF Transcript_28040/g.45130 Transcript_28040/m.45130 type:complete len:106 (-) Transcript_28040:28-345(-)